jgi:ribosomal-protein-alanine N-acetyltransferase
VAEELSRPIACVLVAARPPPSDAADVAGVAVAWRVAGDAHIMELAVRPAVRRRGVGSALLEAACTATCAAGGVCLLEVRESNSGAAALYTRSGFSLVGRRKGYYPDGEAALLMTRLPPG